MMLTLLHELDSRKKHLRASRRREREPRAASCRQKVFSAYPKQAVGTKTKTEDGDKEKTWNQTREYVTFHSVGETEAGSAEEQPVDG